MPHQIATLDWIFTKFFDENINTLLLYHKPGTGKTFIGSLLYLICNSMGINTYIVVPNRGLGLMWEDTIMKLYTITEYFYPPFSYTKNSFTNLLANIVNNVKQIDLSNSIVIIDEAHEIFESELCNYIFQLRDNILNFRLLLMTGTPILNTPKTFTNMLKLLTYKDYSNIIEYGNYVYDIKLKPSMINTIKNDLVGKVSFFNYHESNVAKVNEVNLKLPMQNEQLKIYDDTKQFVSNEMFQQILSNVSLFAIKDFYSVEMIKEVKPGSIVDGFMFKDLLYNPLLSNIDKFSQRSCKLGYFFKNLLEGKFLGKIFIYISNPYYATLILRSIFKALQIAEYGVNENFSNPICHCGIAKNNHILNTTQLTNNLRMEEFKCPNQNSLFKQMTYILITSNTISDPTLLIDKFNEESNDNGVFNKILIGSNIISVGYTLKEVKSIHLISMPTNRNEEDQIIKRAVRLYAHKAPNAIVDLYKYLATHPTDKSYDMKKIVYTQEKYNNTFEAEEILIAASQDIKQPNYKLLDDFLAYEFMRQLFYKTPSNLSSLKDKLKEYKLEFNKSSFCVNHAKKSYYVTNLNYEPIMIPYQKFVNYTTLTQKINNYIQSYNIIFKKNDLYYYTLPSKPSRTLQSFNKEVLIDIYINFIKHLNLTPISNLELLKKEELIDLIIKTIIGTKYLVIYK